MDKQCNMTKSGILGNLEKGLESEKRALALCSELLELVDNEEDKEDLREIIADEKRHIKITDELITIVGVDYSGPEE
ncbi:MAG: hypothetical protein WC458_00195 [Patescibacteria group bacterium]